MIYIYYSLMVAFALALQHGVSELVAIRGVAPDFILIVVAAISLFSGRGSGALWGMATGFIEDSLSGGPLGARAFSLTLVAFIAGSVMSYRSLQRAYSLYAGLTVGALALLHNLIMLIIVVEGSSGWLFALWAEVLLPAVYTMFWALIIFAVVPESIWERIYKTEPSPLF